MEKSNNFAKIKSTLVPSDDKLFLRAVARIQRNARLVLSFADLMTYKECFSLFQPLEYILSVTYFDDMNQTGYITMADEFLKRSNIHPELKGEQTLAKSLCEVRNCVKRKWLDSFYSS